MGFVKSTIDKVLLAATGVGLGFMVLDRIRGRNFEKPATFLCPYCRSSHDMTQSEFAVHIAHIRRNGGFR